jgi:hypothetical protein
VSSAKDESGSMSKSGKMKMAYKIGPRMDPWTVPSKRSKKT